MAARLETTLIEMQKLETIKDRNLQLFTWV